MTAVDMALLVIGLGGLVSLIAVGLCVYILESDFRRRSVVCDDECPWCEPEPQKV